MNTKSIVVGIAATALFGAGGTMAFDQAQNPYTTDGTKLEIVASSTISESGDNKIVAETSEPKVILSKFDGELNMGISYKDIKATGARKLLSSTIEWKEGTKTMQMLPLPASDSLEDGGTEINIVLDSLPETNKFDFLVESAENLVFAYQTPVWQEIGLEGPTADCTDTDCDWGNDGVIHRPENVVGSYAVYYKDHANHIAGETNYATGKVFHIFRPLVTDAKGVSTWADLSYDSGTLTVTVPQKFLESATYPVTIDPTIGYTTIGGSALTKTNANGAVCSRTNAATTTTGQMINALHIYGHMSTVSTTVQGGIYSWSAGRCAILNGSVITQTINTSSDQWWGTSVSITAINGTSTGVAFGSWQANSVVVYMDDLTSPTQRNTQTNPTLTSPWVFAAEDGQAYSWYADLVPGGTPNILDMSDF